MADVPATAPAAPHAGGGVGGSLDGVLADAKKIPPWAWVALGVAGFVAWRTFAGGNGSSASAPGQADMSDTSGATPSGGDVGGMFGGIGDPTGAGASGGSGTPVSSLPPDNGLPDANPGKLPGRLPPNHINPPAGGGGPPAPPVKKPPAPAAAPAQTIHTVASGEVGHEIADQYGVSWDAIYDANEATIEQEARAHGFASSNHGYWIFPNEKLVIP